MKHYINIFILLLILNPNTSLSQETTLDVFIKEVAKNCQKESTIEYCTCTAVIAYNISTDEQKGYVLTGIQLEDSMPELTSDELDAYLSNTYDPTGRIEKGLKKTHKIIKEEIQESCSNYVKTEK